MNQQQKAEAYQQKILALSAELMQQLATKHGFVDYYFSILKNCRSQAAAFRITNLLYELLFGEELFTNYDSFRKHLKRNHCN